VSEQSVCRRQPWGYVPPMTPTAERVLQDIKRLPAADLCELWRQINQLVVEKNSPPLSPAPQVSDEEFAAALDEVTGCTAGQ